MFVCVCVLRTHAHTGNDYAVTMGVFAGRWWVRSTVKLGLELNPLKVGEFMDPPDFFGGREIVVRVLTIFSSPLFP